MKFKFDHDYHIHSQLSACSNDPKQTPEAILQYAKECGLSSICITDHYWDSEVPGVSAWYAPQNFDHISRALPLPQDEEGKVKFYFGCESDMDQFFNIGVPASRFDDFDFILIPTTHLHMKGFTLSREDAASDERRAELWVQRLEALLNMDLPFHKVGIAHLACSLLNPTSRENYLNTLNMISSDDMERLFTKAAALGVGIELQSGDVAFRAEEGDTVKRMFKIAKGCGCKFYFGSDIHHPANGNYLKNIFENAVDVLGLTEDDKFHIGK